MDRPEKILLLQKIMEDMRGAFPKETYKDRRLFKAKELADELGLAEQSAAIQSYVEGHGYGDGRYFRTSYLRGGYCDMEVLHGLTDTYHDKSDEFKLAIHHICEYPEYAFDDYRKETQ